MRSGVFVSYDIVGAEDTNYLYPVGKLRQMRTGPNIRNRAVIRDDANAVRAYTFATREVDDATQALWFENHK